MVATLGAFNPQFYALETLIRLEKRLGLASRVHRGYDKERRAFDKGDIVNIPRPSTFTVQDAPGTAEDIKAGNVPVTVNYHREVKYKLTDKDFAFTGREIIEKHIDPAVYAIAADVDAKLASLVLDIPWHVDLNATPGSVVTDVTAVKKRLRDNNVPLEGQPVFYMMDSTIEMGLTGLANFSQNQGAGLEGVTTQREGFIARKYGMEFFVNQSTVTHTKGTASTGTLAVNGAHLLGAETVNLDAVSVTGTLAKGDTFVIAGNTQRYAVTATVTASGNAFTSVAITPPLVQDYSDNSVVTVTLQNHVANAAFHQNAFALVFAKLPETHVNDLGGGRAFSIQDPRTGIAVRARMWYDGDKSATFVGVDVLYGLRTLDANLATRARHTIT